MPKTVVLFYSNHGNVRKVADELKHLIDADLVELKIPGTEGLSGFMMYFRLGFLAAAKRKPRITGGRDLSEYENIILGSPIWAGTFSPALRSFLSRRSLYGAQVGAYFCHKGGLGQAPKKLDDFLNLGGTLKYADAVDPKTNGTARDLALKIAGKMGLAESPKK